ncbi:MAG: lysyl-tRNA synthetase class 2 [Mariniblastus sp.]|jgi:lysyl-tRNA synthetase class 2
MLKRRAEIVREVRSFFDERGFFEVETPILSHDIVVDQYLHPIGISKKEVTGAVSDSGQKLWLQTSPEFGMKRLLTAGAEAIFQIGKCFRQSESGHRHNPEFTMLEWYRVGHEMHAGMELLATLVEQVLGRPATRKMTYRDAMLEFAGIDPFRSTTSELADHAAMSDVGAGLRRPEMARDDWLNLILSEIVEPKLGWEAPLIVYDWPASQAALAIVREGDDPPVAERFEIYVDGLELANGYHELLDPEELASRNSINNQKRVKDGVPMLPEESRLLTAMKHGMPASAGVAMGIDRLVMLAVGAESIHEVIAFPLERA